MNNVILQRYDGYLMSVDTGATPGLTYWGMTQNPDPNWTAVAFDQVIPYGDASVCDWNNGLTVNLSKFLAVMVPKITDTLNKQINDVALSWGYDSKESLVGYALSSVTKFTNDAKAFITWRDSVWVKANTDAATFAAGGALPDDFDSYLASFPAPPVQP